MTVSAIPSDTTVSEIHYGITLKGINLTEEPLTPKIYIVLSLGECSQSIKQVIS